MSEANRESEYKDKSYAGKKHPFNSSKIPSIKAKRRVAKDKHFPK